MSNDSPSRPVPTKDRVLYVISTAHLDTQWRWTIQDTINNLVPATLRGNFAHFEKHPHYVFSFEGAFRYQIAKEYYPELYAKLREYVAQGRWRVCGSSVDACDTHVPSPESLLRHVLYGNGFFRREFGKTSLDIFLPDCFGFGYALPTVAAHCGLKAFSTQKLGWGSSVGIPFDVGIWVGVDGSSLLAALNPGPYIQQLDHDLSHDQNWIETIERQGKQSGLYVGYKYIGVGDRGGALDDDSISWLERSVTGTGPIRVLSAGADQLARDLSPEQLERLPRYDGELLLTAHGAGCYTSQAAMKRWNRKNELLADAAERTSVAADWLGGAPYPKAKLTEAWTRFLWHQFHDDLTGTSIPEAYVFSWNDEVVSLNQFAQVLSSAAGAVARGLNTSADGVPLVVINPLSIPRQDVVRAEVRFPNSAPAAVRVWDHEGTEVPCQLLSTSGDSATILFLADLPSTSFSAYDVRAAAAPLPVDTGLRITQSELENGRYRVRVDENGDIASILDKAEGKELLSAPIRLELLDHHLNDWPSWEITYADVSAPPRAYVDGPPAFRIAESGPVRVTLEVTRQKEGSTFTQRISLSAGSDRVEVETDVDWKTQATVLKAAFPLSVANPNATYDLGLGTIQRPNNTESKHEVPAQQWADITAADGSYGMAILSESKYGWDKPTDNTLRLTLILTPKTQPGWLEDEATQDIGRHRFTYAIQGHRGDWRQGEVVWQAARLNQPPIPFQTAKHDGPLGKSLSMAHVSTPQVAIRALKKAEESNEVVIRLVELNGQPAAGVAVTVGAGIASGRELRGDEEPLGSATVRDGKLVLDMKPYQPRTFALKLVDPPARVAPPRTAPVQLPYNLDVVSFDADKADGDFDGEGHSLPAELLPATVESEGVTFAIGPTEPGEMNAVACKGQTISLNAAGYNRLYVLAAAAGGDATGVFSVDGVPTEVTVQEFTGLVAQWHSRVVDGKVVNDIHSIAAPFIKRAPIAWTASHRHSAKDGNEAHILCYLYRYCIELPQGASFLTLPNNDRIRVMAVSLAADTNDDTIPAGLLYD